MPVTFIAEPGALPGAKVPPVTFNVASDPDPVNVPPVNVVVPPMLPALTVVPALLVRPPLSAPALLKTPLLLTSPDTIAPAVLLNRPDVVTLPAQILEFVSTPALASKLPVQLPALLIVAMLFLTSPIQTPLAALTMLPLLLATTAL